MKAQIFTSESKDNFRTLEGVKLSYLGYTGNPTMLVPESVVNAAVDMIREGSVLELKRDSDGNFILVVNGERIRSISDWGEKTEFDS